MKDKKTERKRLRAKRLRAKRWTYRAIGRELGVSHQMARRYVVGDPAYDPVSGRARYKRKALKRKLEQAKKLIAESEVKND